MGEKTKHLKRKIYSTQLANDRLQDYQALQDVQEKICCA